MVVHMFWVTRCDSRSYQGCYRFAKEWSAHSDAVEVLELLHGLGYDVYDSQISEPLRKGFVRRYGSFHRPTGFRENVEWLKLSRNFDWWGSWTDIVAILP